MMDLFRSKIANGLKTLRLQKNYSQEYLSDKLGKTDSSAYQRIEAGRTELKFEDAFKLATIYNISMEHIFDPDLRRSTEGFSEDRELYQPKSRIQISVTLDGQEQTLQHQIELLTNVNKALASG